MNKIQNLVENRWVEGLGQGTELHHAVTGDVVGVASTDGIDFESAYEYAREVGGAALRSMTFQERGRMLKRLALHLHGMKDQFYAVSWATGATKVDAWIDIEGGIGNLFANASLRRRLPDTPFATDGEFVPLSKEGTFGGHHILSFPSAGWRCTSTHSISPCGACWRRWPSIGWQAFLPSSNRPPSPAS